jgi:hypothetical protein
MSQVREAARTGSVVLHTVTIGISLAAVPHSGQRLVARAGDKTRAERSLLTRAINSRFAGKGRRFVTAQAAREISPLRLIDWPPYVGLSYAARIAPAARRHFDVAASGGA